MYKNAIKSLEDKVEAISQKSKKENKHKKQKTREKYLKMRRLVKEGQHPNDRNTRKKTWEKWRNGITKTYTNKKQEQKT